MKQEFECLNCGAEIVVEEPQQECTCPDCNKVFGVDYDAEFVDGSWRNLTKLFVKEEGE